MAYALIPEETPMQKLNRLKNEHQILKTKKELRTKVDEIVHEVFVATISERNSLLSDQEMCAQSIIDHLTRTITGNLSSDERKRCFENLQHWQAYQDICSMKNEALVNVVMETGFNTEEFTLPTPPTNIFIPSEQFAHDYHERVFCTRQRFQKLHPLHFQMSDRQNYKRIVEEIHRQYPSTNWNSIIKVIGEFNNNTFSSYTLEEQIEIIVNKINNPQSIQISLKSACIPSGRNKRDTESPCAGALLLSRLL